MRKWKIECTIDVEFKQDGKVVWTESGADYPGTWELKDRMLTLKLDNGQVLKYPVKMISSKFMLITNQAEDGSSFDLGCCPQ